MLLIQQPERKFMFLNLAICLENNFRRAGFKCGK